MFVIIFTVIHWYRYAISHHKVIKDDASPKVTSITVGFGTY